MTLSTRDLYEYEIIDGPSALKLMFALFDEDRKRRVTFKLKRDGYTLGITASVNSIEQIHGIPTSFFLQGRIKSCKQNVMDNISFRYQAKFDTGKRHGLLETEGGKITIKKKKTSSKRKQTSKKPRRGVGIGGASGLVFD